MVTLCARSDAWSDKLDVVKVYDVQVVRMQALQRAAHAAAYGGGGVVKVGGTGIRAGAGAVAAHLGEESVRVAREFVLKSL
jgi:hypothetical protein